MQTLKLTKKYEKYPEYKDSGVEWFGKVPKDWQVGPLRSVLVERVEKNKKLVTDNILSVMKDVGVIRYADKGDVGNKSSDRPENYKIVHAGDIVLNSMNLVIGSVGQSKELGVTSSVYIIYHPRNKEIFADYYHYLFRNKSWQKTLGRLGKGIMELRESINSDLLKIEPVPIPPFNQQKTIVDFLDEKTFSIDQIIEKKQKLIDFLHEKRTSLINKAVMRGLDHDVELVESGVNNFGKIPKSWSIQKMKFLARKPLQYGANEAGLNDDNSQPRFIRITDIDEAGNLRQDIFKSLDPELAKPYLLEEGDVLFARTGGTVGKSFRYKKEWGPCCYAGYLIRMSVNQKKINSEYLEYITKADYYWKWIDSIFIRSTIQNVSAEKYKEFLIALPPIKEQEKILNVLNKEIPLFDEAIKKVEKTIDYLKEFKSSLISSVVTGKIKV